MDRLDQYLEIVPLPVLLLLLAAAVFVALIIPGRLRLPVMLMVMPPWLSIGQFLDLGAVQAVAKATGFVMFALLALSAYLHPGPKRRLSPWVWVYPVVALCMIPFVVTTTDRDIAIVIQIQWLLLCVAAIAVGRTVVTDEDLLARMRMMALGLAGVIIAILSEILIHPSAVFARGLGRIQPWGADPNQIGTVMVMGVPLLFFFGLRERRVYYKLGFLALAGLGTMVGLATGSRSTLFPLVIMLPVIGARYVFKPLTLMALAGAAVVAYFASKSFVGEVNTSRLGNLETARYDTWQYYFNQHILVRPLTGLLGTSGQSWTQAVGREHPHNAYIQLLYRFGFPLTAPMLLLAAVTMRAAYKLWKHRRYFCNDPTLITVIVAMLFTVYVHGMPTTAIYHPNYDWAFFHVLLSVWTISVAAQGLPISASQPAEQAYDGGAYAGYEHYGQDETDSEPWASPTA